ADATAHEIEQNQNVEKTGEAGGKTEDGGRNPEAYHVSQGIQFPSHGRGAVPPTRHPSVRHVEDQGQHHKCAGGIQLAGGTFSHMIQGEEYCRRPTSPVSESEYVREVEVADHREMARHDVSLTCPPARQRGESIERHFEHHRPDPRTTSGGR